MPSGDRRGPNGMGPMTGRGAGFCNGANAPGYMSRGAGRGLGGRFHGFASGAACGRGRGFGRGYFSSCDPYSVPPYSKENEKEYVETEVSFLKEQLKALEGRLADMQEDE